MSNEFRKHKVLSIYQLTAFMRRKVNKFEINDSRIVRDEMKK